MVIEVEVGEVYCHELSIFCGYDTVEQDFGYQHLCCRCCHVPRVVDSIPANSKPCSVYFCFFGLLIAYTLSILYVLHSVLVNFVSMDEEYCVGALDLFTNSLR